MAAPKENIQAFHLDYLLVQQANLVWPQWQTDTKFLQPDEIPAWGVA